MSNLPDTQGQGSGWGHMWCSGHVDAERLSQIEAGVLLLHDHHKPEGIPAAVGTQRCPMFTDRAETAQTLKLPHAKMEWLVNISFILFIIVIKSDVKSQSLSFLYARTSRRLVDIDSISLRGQHMCLLYARLLLCHFSLLSSQQPWSSHSWSSGSAIKGLHYCKRCADGKITEAFLSITCNSKSGQDSALIGLCVWWCIADFGWRFGGFLTCFQQLNSYGKHRWFWASSWPNTWCNACKITAINMCISSPAESQVFFFDYEVFVFRTELGCLCLSSVLLFEATF